MHVCLKVTSVPFGKLHWNGFRKNIPKEVLSNVQQCLRFCYIKKKSWYSKCYYAFQSRYQLCVMTPRPDGAICCDFEEEGRRHRIAFNSLYLFSFRSIIYEANGEELYNVTRGATVSCLSIVRELPQFLLSLGCARSIVSGGVASMTRDIPWLASVERPPPSAYAAILWPG